MTVSYRCQAGDAASKNFKVATFGLSCYIIASENDFLDQMGIVPHIPSAESDTPASRPIRRDCLRGITALLSWPILGYQGVQA
jgi:hypothetical protein